MGNHAEQSFFLLLTMCMFGSGLVHVHACRGEECVEQPRTGVTGNCESLTPTWELRRVVRSLNCYTSSLAPYLFLIFISLFIIIV